MRSRPLRSERIDDALEGDVCVSEGVEVGAANSGQQIGERGCGVDIGAQDQRSDEHTDHRIQEGISASGDR